MDYAFFEHLSDAVMVLSPDQKLVYRNQSALDISQDAQLTLMELATQPNRNNQQETIFGWTLHVYDHDGDTIVVCKAKSDLSQRIDDVKSELARLIDTGMNPPEAAARLLHRELGWKWTAVAHYLNEEQFEIDAFIEDGNLYGPITLDIADTPCDLVRDAQNFLFFDNVGKRFKGSEELGAQNYAGMVYRSSAGEEIGHIYMLNDTDDVDIAATSLILEAVCCEIGLHLELAKAKQALDESQKMSLRDPLTGIGNRRAFDRDLEVKLEAAKGDGSDGAIVFFDLDGFKQLNDDLGHKAGDQALIKTAQVALNLCEEGCDIYRYGGDEFVILCHNSAHWCEETTLDKRFMLQNYLADQGFEDLGVSIGVATFCEADNCKENLLRLADKRMYDDKRQRKSKTGAAA